ncbi:MAG: trypsin-like serine peptidase [Planctomycetota bacterium]
MRSYAAVGLGLLTSLFLTVAEVTAQANPLAQIEVAVALDSGPVMNTADKRGVIFEGVVEVPDALWVRLTFDRAVLGVDPKTGREATLRMTSLADGAAQTHTATTLRQWNNTSAYFNGDAVKVEIIADPGAAGSRVTVTRVLAGPQAGGAIASICGPTDDRVLSSDPRAARAVPVGCTVWLIGDAQNCFLTAGHCAGSSLDIVEFNVPLSGSGGNIVHPGPEDQYAVDVSSTQSINGGVGNDWGYFGCFANTETGLTAGEAQGQWYPLAASPPPVSGQMIRITGYGVDSSPPTWNQVQQTHAGPYVTFSGTTVQYRTDTEGGNSGSAVLNESTGLAIGIHTHGGCDSVGGQNSGTGINHPGLQAALATPQGICIPEPPLAFAFPDGLPELIDPHGDTIRVEVSGQNGGTPQPDTGVLHLSVDGPYVPIAMVEISPNVYDAVFPAVACGTVAQYYFSAETTEAEVVTNPLFAPASHYSAISAVSQQTVFLDSFETDQGWLVHDEPGLTTGTWERGIPVGGGDRGDPPTDADGSGQCYLTYNADGDSDVDNGATILTSPPMDASQGIPVISYWRWFSNTAGSSPLQDIFVVEVSDDGGATWWNLETVGPTGPEVDGGWFEKEFLVDDFVDLTDRFVIRFIASDTDPQSVVEAAVDGVRLSKLDCGTTPPGDLDGDGIVGITDFLILLAEWGPCPDPCPPACLGDLDESCSVDLNDFLILLANWTP